jgi:hypothetical protein
VEIKEEIKEEEEKEGGRNAKRRERNDGFSSCKCANLLFSTKQYAHIYASRKAAIVLCAVNDLAQEAAAQ